MEVRRAVQADEDAVLKLIGAEAFIITKRFASLEIGKQIETSMLSLVSLDGSGAVTGFVCFGDKPAGSALEHGMSPAEWEYWLPKRFNIEPIRFAGLDTDNSAWLTCFAADHETEHEIFYELICDEAIDCVPGRDCDCLPGGPDHVASPPAGGRKKLNKRCTLKNTNKKDTH